MTNKKTLAVIGGTGNEGPGLAARWAASGKYDVIIGSRKAEKAQRVAAELNAQMGQDLLRGMANADAVAAADLAALTVPYSAHRPTLEGLKEALKGKVLIDVTVPLAPPKVSHVKIPPGGSAGQEAQAILGDEVAGESGEHDVVDLALAAGTELDHFVDVNKMV